MLGRMSSASKPCSNCGLGLCPALPSCLGLYFDAGNEVTASKAATAGGSASGSWVLTLLPGASDRDTWHSFRWCRPEVRFGAGMTTGFDEVVGGAVAALSLEGLVEDSLDASSLGGPRLTLIALTSFSFCSPERTGRAWVYTKDFGTIMAPAIPSSLKTEIQRHTSRSRSPR